MHTDALLEFCQILEIQSEEVKGRETPERISLPTSVPIRRLKRLTNDHVYDLINSFGSALELTIEIEGARPLLRVRQGIPEADIAISLKEILALPDDLQLQVNVQINKRDILHQFDLDLELYNGLFYLYLDNLVKLLQAPLPDVDRNLFSSATTPTVAIVSDTETVCQGALFTVFGVQSGLDLNEILPVPSKRLRQRISTSQKTALDSLNWAGFDFDHLTPLHFLCEFTKGPSEDLANVIANRLLQLTILYTANRSIIDGHQIKVLYASSEYSVDFIISETGLAVKLKSDIVKLITWLQAAGEIDKLTTFQNVIAREITGDDPEKNFEVFVERFSALLRETRWHYRVYLDGKITKHFEKVQSVSSYLADVTREISQTLDSMTKGFVDTLLASVGVIILTFLASLVENTTQGIIFRVGMWTYAIYLMLFQVLYRMGHLYRSYSLTTDESDQQLLPFKVALGENKIAELTTSFEKRKLHFRRMYWITIGLYILVILIIVISGWLLPSVIAQLTTTSPTPVLTPGSGVSPVPTPTLIPADATP